MACISYVKKNPVAIMNVQALPCMLINPEIS